MVDPSRGPQPADFADVRATNLAVVLRYVRAYAPCSRADIAVSTGLNKTTVSSLVAELIERRILRESGTSARRIGRPATMLTIDGGGYAGIGVEVGVEHLSAAVVDLAGQQLLTWRRPFGTVEGKPGRVIAEVAALARRAADRVQAQGRTTVGLTVAVPGLIDPTGVVRRAPALGWVDVELRAGLERALGDPGYPIGVDTGARLGAVAEYRYGALAGTAHLVYLAGPPGGGIGVINGGVPLRGANGNGGDALGHLLAPAGTDASGPLAQEAEVEQLARRASTGEPRALATLAEVGRRLGCAVATLVNLLDPAVLMLGGHYASLATWLLPTVERETRRAAPHASELRLARSTLGYEAAALGGAAVPLDAIDSARSAFNA